MKRRISHAELIRSTPGRGRVTHRRPVYDARSIGPSAGSLARARSSAGVRSSSCARQRDHAVASGAAEEVDALERRQTLAEHVEQAPDGRLPRAAGPARGVEPPRRPVRSPAPAPDTRPGAPPELLDEGIIRPGVDAVGGEDAGVAAGALDLRLQPLEVLARRRRVGQHVDRLLDRHRAELLQPAPRAHPQVGRRRRQLVDEQQPATRRRAARRLAAGAGAGRGCVGIDLTTVTVVSSIVTFVTSAMQLGRRTQLRALSGRRRSP